MKEQFVPYEIAFLLKEKGFNIPCIGWYYNPTGTDPDLFLVEYGEAEDNNSVILDPNQEDMKDVSNWKQICDERKHSCCSAPLWQQVIDWFRVQHNLRIFENTPICAQSSCSFNENFKFELVKITGNGGHSNSVYGNGGLSSSYKVYSTYEEARLVAINDALKLI